jgi:hypothetical protein
MTMHHLVDRFQDASTLQNLTIAETEAFVDLLIFTVLADGTITEEELDSLADQWAQLPFAGDDAMETLMGEYGSSTREYLEENEGDDDAIDTFLQKVADRVVRDEVRTAALHMVALVSQADGVGSREADLCYQIGTLFGWTEERISKTVDDILSQ